MRALLLLLPLFLRHFADAAGCCCRYAVSPLRCFVLLLFFIDAIFAICHVTCRQMLLHAYYAYFSYCRLMLITLLLRYLLLIRHSC